MRWIRFVVIKFGVLPLFATKYFCPNPAKKEINVYILHKPIQNQMHSRDSTSSYIELNINPTAKMVF